MTTIQSHDPNGPAARRQHRICSVTRPQYTVDAYIYAEVYQQGGNTRCLSVLCIAVREIETTVSPFFQSLPRPSQKIGSFFFFFFKKYIQGGEDPGPCYVSYHIVSYRIDKQKKKRQAIQNLQTHCYVCMYVLRDE